MNGTFSFKPNRKLFSENPNNFQFRNEQSKHIEVHKFCYGHKNLAKYPFFCTKELQIKLGDFFQTLVAF